MFDVRHHNGLSALLGATGNPSVSAVIHHLLASGVPWGKIMTVLITVLPAILAQDWPAVIAALLVLLHPTPPAPPTS